MRRMAKLTLFLFVLQQMPLELMYSDFYEKVEDAMNVPLNISGVIVDKNGAQLNDVEVKIVKYIFDAVTKKSIKEKESEVVQSDFSLSFQNCHGVYLTFSKEGYRYYKVNLDSMSNRYKNIDNSNKENVVIVLNKIGELTDEVVSKYAQTSETYLNGISQRTKYKFKVSEIENDIYVSKFETNNFDILSDSGVSFLKIDSESSDFNVHECKIAPEGGYQDYLRLSIPDKSNRLSYFFFKTPDGYYGKAKIYFVESDENGIKVKLRYFINSKKDQSLNTIDF